MLIRAAASVAAGLLALGTVTTHAAAVGDDLIRVGRGDSPDSGSVVLHPRDPGGGGGNGGGGGGTTPAPVTVKKPGKSTCTFLGQKLPSCTSDYGQWDQDQQCWVQRLSPQPPADDPRWAGHTDGAVWRCFSPGVQGVMIGGSHYYWAPTTGPGAPVLVDPVTLAEEAIEQMELVGARVGATPLDPSAPGVVGIQAWLWIDNDGPASYGPITRTATAGSVSVTATAKVTKVVWDTGDGASVTCRNPGTKWTRADGGDDSPTCGHTYLRDSGDQPDDAYQLQATTHWEVQWSGAGQAGTIDFTLTGPARAMPVVELQALRTR